ncbi:MAG: InlB B-repeat-containing protein [Acholeplasmatales bacterium]|nr:InlB B-repeat-containing protein [Acholeplasmatales bacterium]
MKKRFLSIFIFVFMIFLLVGCSGTIDEDVILIDSITSETMSDGKTKVTIKYQNEDKKEDVFFIPKGVDGTGISDFVYNVNKEDNTTDITFSFTDTFDDYTVKVPNGVGIKNVSYTQDENGDTLMTFIYTNGETSDPVRVQKGQIGTSLTGFTPTVNSDNSVDLKFIYSDGSEYIAKIPAPEKGDTGRSISTIVSATTDSTWQMIVFYNDDTFDTIEFERPASIISGVNPTDEQGKDGDFFYDTAKKIFYNKIDGVWVRVIQFDDDTIRYSVSFDINCDDASAALHGKSQITVKKNSYLPTSSIPVPTRDGYVFAGWYTS